MTVRHGDRLVAGGSDGRPHDDPSSQGSASTAENETEPIRRNRRGAGPVAGRDRAVLPATGRSAAPETTDAGTGVSDADPTGDRLVEPVRAADLRRRWDTITASFVDDPRVAVEHAEELTGEVVTELAAALEARRRDLSERCRDAGTGGEAETELLRIVMRGYRDILDRCLA